MSSGHHLSGRLRALASCLRPVAVFAGLALAVFTVSRLFLAWRYSDRLAATDGLAAVLSRSWLFDAVVICAICAPVVLVLALAPSRLLASRGFRIGVGMWFASFLALVVFNEAATPDFMAEFGVRPNRLYVEYLDTPTEIAATIWTAHRTGLFVGVASSALGWWLAWRLMRPQGGGSPMPSWSARFLAFTPLVLLLCVGARGSIGHRPLNISHSAFSTDSAVNDLALNSSYSVAKAIASQMRARSSIESYKDVPRDETIRRVRAAMQLPETAFTDPKRPTTHRLAPSARHASKPNLVVLLQESLGAQYIASLGGDPVAERIEQWRGRSFWFDQLYATGTRSARGIEAVVTGFPPSRASSVIKLDGAQQDFFTLARALKQQGYRTEFIYGGDSSFDNMRRFFLGNGFDRVLDWSDLKEKAEFETTWGVSDEDLYVRIHEEVSAHAAEEQPFFTLVFSTSNHPPYDFPDGKITLFEEPKMTRRNAARYADFAVCEYLDVASRSPYWEDTLFMVVADHESHVRGHDLVPIFDFKIPAFIAGKLVEPRIVARLASQMDLVPTVLSLMGLEVELPATGLDQSRTDLTGPGRAVMQFNDDAAYRVGDDVVILEPDLPPRQFRVEGRELVSTPADRELVQDALAQAFCPVLAFRERWYR